MAKKNAAFRARRTIARRWLAAGSAAIGAMLLQSLPAHAQANPVDCGPIDGQPLNTPPEIQSGNGVLLGTVVVTDQQQRLMLSDGKCQPQYVRTFQKGGAPSPPPGQYANPTPGPTLRARVGDFVTLTFLNQINPADFPGTDRGEKGLGCDRSSAGYPNKVPNTVAPETFPNCFHGSTTANIHFHGTHTSPDATGDNVYLQVRPSPRDPATRQLTVTADTVRNAFARFFAECQRRLSKDVLLEWPRTWSDLPPETQAWTKEQELLLRQYAPEQWDEDEAELKKGLWPQWYMGAFPYCFRLPEYTASASGGNPAMIFGARGAALAAQAAPALRMGQAAPALRMGQAPGTHWYHAHKHGSTWINVSNGMSGAFVIEGQYDDELNTYYSRYGVSDWTRRQPPLVINQLQTVPPLLARGGPTPFFFVNGGVRPRLRMWAGEVQLWRMVNTSPRSALYFAGPQRSDPKAPIDPNKDFQWKQVAQDGVQFNDANYQMSVNPNVLMASGNRADFLVKAPMQPGSYKFMAQAVAARADLENPAPTELLSVEVQAPEAGQPSDMSFIPEAPTFPAFLKDITDEEVKGHKRTITFETNSQNPHGYHTINGVKFGADGSGVLIQLNTVEEWKVVNTTNVSTAPGLIDHPFHIHINPFQVVEVFDPNEKLRDSSGNPVDKYVFKQDDLKVPGQCLLNPDGDPDSWKPCGERQQRDFVWWDVFAIPSAKQVNNSQGKSVVIPGYFKMRSRFVDYPGQYVLHCHILAHEDRGMMTMVKVLPFATGMSHH